MRNATILNDLLSRVSDAGRALVLSSRSKPQDTETSLKQLCTVLLSRHGEATGLALGREILDRYDLLEDTAKADFFCELVQNFGVDHEALESAVSLWLHSHSEQASRELHFASEPRSQELVRRLNRAPGGISDLVSMREDLLAAIRREPALKSLDLDFHHLFGSWFNRGFLELRRIDWSTPAEILEKIITYEAVHQINGWNELRQRVAAPDRRLYAFFHPALVNEPLIFVEVALTAEIPDAIPPILSDQRVSLDPKEATTAVFYSISNCQRGLKGISFGNFLIKQVVEELRREFGNIQSFVTLSPVPGLRKWVNREIAKRDDNLLLSAGLEGIGDYLQSPSFDSDPDILQKITALYFLEAKTEQGLPVDPVARFHLGNGARLEQVNLEADPSERGRQYSWGVMVNYLYDLNDIEKNHEMFANEGLVVCSSAVRDLLKTR